MRKGISPIVAVVLLIAIAVIAAVGLYFWVGGLATKQPTPTTPGTITAICTGDVAGGTGQLLVTNIGANALTDVGLTVTGTTDTTCDAVPSASGNTAVCSTDMAAGETGTVYGAATGAAQYSC
ncbi:archaellin/type IV pilin N-terminal domain-containing protein [archaeon]